MKIDIEEIGPCTKLLKIEIPHEIYTREEDKAYVELGKKTKVPGFRQGKVPKEYLKKLHHNHIKNDVLNKVVPEYYYNALVEKGLKPIGSPKLENVKYEKDSPVTFTATIDIIPPFEINNYEGLEFTRKIVKTTDEDVEKELNYYREHFATYEEITDRAVEDSDFVIIDYEGFINNKPLPGVASNNFPLVIGSNSLIEGLENKIIGMNKNEEKDIPLTYPSEYSNKEFAGKDVVFKVKLNEIKLKKLPEINDQFIKNEMGQNKTLVELKKEIHKNQEKREKLIAETKLHGEIINKLIEINPHEIPPSLIESQIDFMVEDFKQKMRLRGIKEEHAKLDREKFRKDSIQIIKGTFIQQKIAEIEKLEPNKTEIEEGLKQIADEKKMAIEKLRIAMQKDESYQNFLSDLQRKKTMDFILSKLKIKEVFVNRNEIENKTE